MVTYNPEGEQASVRSLELEGIVEREDLASFSTFLERNSTTKRAREFVIIGLKIYTLSHPQSIKWLNSEGVQSTLVKYGYATERPDEEKYFVN